MDHADILRDFPLGVSLIEAEEGYEAKPYKCSRGFWTIGHGFNLIAHGYSETEFADWVWDRQKAQAMLLDELVDIIAVLDRRFPAWREKLDAVREAVVLSSFYQLGVNGALAFKNTIAMVQAGDWEGAAQGIMASRWAKQDPERAQRNADAMRTGKLPEVVRGVRIFPAPTVAELAPTPVQSGASVLPDDGPEFTFDDVQETIQSVRAGNLQASPGFSKILKALSTSKTIWGTLSLLVMVIWQTLGIQSWSDIGFSVRGHIYPLTDIFPLIAPAFATLAAWGKVKQTMKGGGHA